MAGGGIAGAITSLKNNRKLLKKRKLRGKEEVYGVPTKTQLNLKVSTDQDMKLIRKKIAGYKREERRVLWWSMLTALVILYVVYVLVLA